MNTEYIGRGGKREGSGRKATGRTTKAIRVPKNCPDINDLLQLWELTKQYKHELDLDPKVKTSPRWEQMRNFLNEIPECLFIDSEK